ncbi:MAG TPA: S1 family peptidase [Kofleriaceae bacterium]
MTHSTIAALALACTLFGCVGDAEDPADNDAELATTSQDIIGGTATYAAPEIGLLHVGNALCTATMITPRLLLTAAHCVNYANRYTDTHSGTFTIKRSSTAKYVYYTTRYESYGSASEGYKDDLAIVRLASAVPSTVASPYYAGHSYPAGGSGIAIYGYGDTNPFSQTGFGTKRVWKGSWNGTLAPYLSGIDFVIAEGDSGGPVVAPGHGIIGVSSRYYYNTSTSEYYDYFAYVVPAYPWIVALERSWG